MRSLRSKMLMGYALPIALIVLNAITQNRSIDSTEEALKWVAHTEEVLSDCNRLLLTVVDAETGERGFLLSHRREFLEPYWRSNETFVSTAADLRSLVADSPAQLQRVDRVAALFLQWRIEVGEPSIRANSEGAPDGVTDANAALLYAARSKEIVDQIRMVLDEFSLVENALLQQRTEAGRAKIDRERTIGVLIPALAVLTAAIAGFWLASRITRPLSDVTRAAESLHAGQLGARAVVRSRDETGRLALAFNAMAERVAERDRESELLKDLSQDMQACMQLSEAYEIFTRCVPRLFDRPTSGAVYLASASRNVLAQVVGWGELEHNRDTLNPEECWALRWGRTYFVDDAPSRGNCQHNRGSGGASLCVPLIAHGEATGVLHVSAEREALGPNSRRLVDLVAEQVALALANLQLRERLRSQSIRDPLTSLFNRRYLEETLSREIARAHRSRQALGIIIFDVDHFKRFNDTYGHDAGDTVLREMGSFILRSFRASDVSCRYGGEEFVIVVPDSELEQLERRAERLREAVKQLGLTHHGLSLGSVSISIGIAAYPLHGDSPETVLAAADAALYRAKNGGRDRVVVAELRRTTPMVTDPPSSRGTGAVR